MVLCTMYGGGHWTNLTMKLAKTLSKAFGGKDDFKASLSSIIISSFFLSLLWTEWTEILSLRGDKQTHDVWTLQNNVASSLLDCLLF